MDLSDIKPTIIDNDEMCGTLAKPRAYTFDNPAMVRVLIIHTRDASALDFIDNSNRFYSQWYIKYFAIFHSVLEY